MASESRLLRWLLRPREIRKAKLLGYFLPWEEALTRVQQNNGFIILNFSSIDGEVWWSAKADAPDDPLIALVDGGRMTDATWNDVKRVAPRRVVVAMGSVRDM